MVPGTAGVGDIGRVPELRKRIFFTLLMLVVYRIGAHVPTPGINTDALEAFFASAQGTLLGMFDMFSGGALSRLTIFALGIMPYISASIILQLMTIVSPTIEALKKEGEAGRRKITQYTRYGTVILAIFQGYGIAIGLESMSGPGGLAVVPDPGWSFRLLTVLTLTTGTVFLMWLGEQITERGIGNGISLIIYSGIVANLPVALYNTGRMSQTGDLSYFFVIFLFVMAIAVTAGVVYMERAQRRITIQYAKRQVGRKVMGGQSTFMPLKVNMAGVIPPIFASSIILFPLTIANFAPVDFLKTITAYLSPGQPLYMLVYTAAIFFFCFFYTAIVFNPHETADNLKKYGGFIPGIRPGVKTAEYFDKVLSRLTFAGAIYIAIVCLIPEILIAQYHVPFYFGGTSLLIIVVVTIDTTSQIQAHLMSHQYEGLMKKSNLRGTGR